MNDCPFTLIEGTPLTELRGTAGEGDPARISPLDGLLLSLECRPARSTITFSGAVAVSPRFTEGIHNIVAGVVPSPQLLESQTALARSYIEAATVA